MTPPAEDEEKGDVDESHSTRHNSSYQPSTPERADSTADVANVESPAASAHDTANEGTSSERGSPKSNA